MKINLEYRTCLDAQTQEKLGEMMMQGFNVQQKDEWLFYPQMLGWDNYRIVCQGNQIQGGLAILETEQYWGGKALLMGAIASVSVLPEYRGQGVAKTLLTQMLKELHTRQIPLSTLYAATQYLYRQVGYEQGGTHCLWKAPINKIATGKRALPITRTSLDSGHFCALHSDWAKHHNGNLQRNSIFWNVLLHPPKQTVFAYLIGHPEHPEGYIIFTQNSGQLLIKDWLSLTPQATQQLWTFIGNHNSQLETVFWRDSSLDPRIMLLPEQTAEIEELERWMLRIVDVQAALTLRGYPAYLATELHLEIQDPIITENNGRFVLRVDQGQGRVEQGGTGEMQLEIKGLAALYSGLYSPVQLQRIGYLSASDTAIAIATQIFTYSEPWMSDKF